jgi:hypothetical protein
MNCCQLKKDVSNVHYQGACKTLRSSINHVLEWAEKNDYQGYEPYDGLTSYLRVVTFGHPLVERILEQMVLRCPFHVRPLLGVPSQRSFSGMGLFAKGYIRMWSLTGDEQYKNKAISCLDWLLNNYSQGFSGYCWGLNYDYTFRLGHRPKHTPDVVTTSIIADAFLDSCAFLKIQKHRDAVNSICEFLTKDVPFEKDADGICISYVPTKQQSIHNSNMLVAAVLSKASSLLDNTSMASVAKDAVSYTCCKQLSNGAWYYGEAPNLRWIDNWHTGYILDSLKDYSEYTEDQSFSQNLVSGLSYYTSSFINDDGCPNFYENRKRPIDIQCAAQTIETLSYFSNVQNTNSLQLAVSVAEWTIKNMQDKDGYFYYRLLPWKKVKIPMIRWGQATMFSALSYLLSKLNNT